MNKSTIYEGFLIESTMSIKNQIPPRGYSKTDFVISITRELINCRSRNPNGSRRNNQPWNRALANFTGEVPSVGAALETVSEHHSMKNQFNNFQDKGKQYVLRKFGNPSDITIVVRDPKDPYAHVDTDKPIKLSKDYK